MVASNIFSISGSLREVVQWFVQLDNNGENSWNGQYLNPHHLTFDLRDR